MAAPSASNQAQEAQCFFFKLPPELRNEIYSLAVAVSDDPDEDDPVSVTNRVKDNIAYLGLDRGVPGIIYACRQIKDETLALYFSHNSFYFGENPGVLPTSTALGGMAIKHMKHIEWAWSFGAHRRDAWRRIRTHVEENGRLRIELENMPEDVCSCTVEDSLRAGAVLKVQETGGKLGLAFAVMACFEENHLKRLQAPSKNGSKPGVECSECGRATWAPRRSGRSAK